jgi:hypothetical protein
MKDKLYDPARNNEKSPAPGMAAVNTFNEGEDPNDRKEGNKKTDQHTEQTTNKALPEKED